MQQLLPQLHSACRPACVSTTSPYRYKSQVRTGTRCTARQGSLKPSALPELTLQKLDTASLTAQPETLSDLDLLPQPLLLQGYVHMSAPFVPQNSNSSVCCGTGVSQKKLLSMLLCC